MTRVVTLWESARRELVRFGTAEGGTTAIEYAMIAAGVGVCIAATVMGLGAQLKLTYYDKLAALFP